MCTKVIIKYLNGLFAYVMTDHCKSYAKFVVRGQDLRFVLYESVRFTLQE